MITFSPSPGNIAEILLYEQFSITVTATDSQGSVSSISVVPDFVDSGVQISYPSQDSFRIQGKYINALGDMNIYYVWDDQSDRTMTPIIATKPEDVPDTTSSIFRFSSPSLQTRVVNYDATAVGTSGSESATFSITVRMDWTATRNILRSLLRRMKSTKMGIQSHFPFTLIDRK